MYLFIYLLICLFNLFAESIFHFVAQLMRNNTEKTNCGKLIFKPLEILKFSKRFHFIMSFIFLTSQLLASFFDEKLHRELS